MKSVIFIIFDKRAESIRRFLLVSDILANLNIKSFFLDSVNSLSETIREYAQILGITHLPAYIKYNAFSSKNINPVFGSLHKKGEKHLIFDSSLIPKSYPGNNKLGQLLNQLHINSEVLIDLNIGKEFISFVNDFRTAENILDTIKPLCVIHDTELPQKNRAIFLASRQRNINIISMLHGEGVAEQIDKLPIISDSYVAYGLYNYEKLKEMGVEEKRIFLTGNPDTDLVYNYNIETIKRELIKKYSIDFSKKVFLIALRPNTDKVYLDLNIELLDIFHEYLANNNDIEIVIKQHPVDICLYVTTDYAKLLATRYKNMKIVFGDCIISKLFAVCDYFITHKTSAIVEAILLNVPTIVIEKDDCKWPDWNRYNIYDSVKIEDIGGILAQIKNGTYADKLKYRNGEREEFIHYFRYKFDNNSAKRIANAINKITDNVLGIENTVNSFNQQGEEFFIKGDMEKAIEAFKKAIEVEPGFADSYNNLGVAFWRTGDIQNALKYLTEALKIEPIDKNATLNMGKVMANLGKYEEAIKIYTSYLHMNPNDKEIVLALSNINSKRDVALQSINSQISIECSQKIHEELRLLEIHSVLENDILKHTNRISFELSNLCNYSNIHKKCPLNKTHKPVILPAKIVYDVINTLANYNFNKTIAFHTYSEPLIDPRLFRFIEFAKKVCPESYIYICTNGYYFNEILAEEIVEIGVSEIHISAYSHAEYNRLSSIKLPIPYKVELMILDDRLNLYNREIDNTQKPCYAPLNEIIISREGVISLCCLDWRRDYTFGNLFKQSFRDILKSGILQAVYEKLTRGERFLHTCKRCGWIR